MEREQEMIALSKLVLEMSAASNRTFDLDLLLERLFFILKEYPGLYIEQRGVILLHNPRGNYLQVAQYGIPPAWQFSMRWESPRFNHPVESDHSSIEQIVFSDGQEDAQKRWVVLLPLHNEDGGIGYAVIFTELGIEISHADQNFFDDLARVLSGLVRHSLAHEALSIRELEIEEARADALRSLGVASEYRDSETGYHIMRMANYAVAIAKAMGLDDGEREMLYIAAPMHDVGKIGIADAILLKPGKLTPEEFAIMKTHTTIGITILDGKDEIIDAARNIAGYHHERWDGQGYPEQRKGVEIPLFARICAVADVFDALTSARPYKTPWTVEAARDWVLAESGKHFDPEVVKAFIAAMPEIMRIRELYRDDIINPRQVLKLPEIKQRENVWVPWDDSLSIGIDIIDEHHRYLFDLVNDLHTVVVEKGEAREIARLLQSLDSYAKIHFRAEEQMMEHYGYQEHDRQVHQHHAFEKKLQEFSAQLYANPLVARFDVLSYLRNWLINHIRHEDAKLATLIAA